ITPRRTRLLRVPDLRAFRAVIHRLVHPPSAAEGADAIVVVPTRSAAAQLACGAPRLTRDELYDELQSRLADPPRRLSALERGVIAQAAARSAAEAVAVDFQLRPGLVAEMLRFYDQMRRQSQQVTRFEELISSALGAAPDDDADIDRGARRM